MTANRLTSELRRELAAIATQAECELIHAEFEGGRLRLVLDRPEGVTIDDCSTVSRQASAVLDVAEFGLGKYTLEVSSPGLDRELYKPADYVRFTGSLAKVTWQSPDMERKRTIVGRLAAFDEADEGTVTVIENQTEERFELSLRDIRVTRLEIEQ